MSRVGKKPIKLPEGTSLTINDSDILVKGLKGELKEALPNNVIVKEENGEVTVAMKNIKEKGMNALWGTWRSLIANMIEGVSEGFEKKLEVNGVGYKAELKGDKLVLHVGYSHPVEYQVPEGVSINIEKNIISVSGTKKQLVGEVAAQIRKVKKPEPYKGKGIKYDDEVIRRKAGKSLKGTEG